MKIYPFFKVSVKYEYYENLRECKKGIYNYIELYNKLRIYQSLDYWKPDGKYYGLEKQKLKVA